VSTDLDTGRARSRSPAENDDDGITTSLTSEQREAILDCAEPDASVERMLHSLTEALAVLRGEILISIGQCQRLSMGTVFVTQPAISV
jgi:hypothetical protein